jgi:hypothetical protein
MTTKTDRISAGFKVGHSALRLPLALGLVGLMVTGTAAMAWPVLKASFVPASVALAPATPADPAAVAGFVDMTRAQITADVALARPSDMAAPVLANAATNLMLDASILRLPHAGSASALGPVASALPKTNLEEESSANMLARQEPLPQKTATVRPATPSAAANLRIPEARVVRTSAAPAAAAAPAPAPARERLVNMWMSGAYR